MISLGCLSNNFDYHSKLLVMTLLPIAVCAALMLLGFVFKERKGLFFTLILVVTYAVLPSVSTAIFGAFPCDKLDTEKSYLIADYSIDCGEAAYMNYTVYCGFSILLYPVGIPLLYAMLLENNKRGIKRPVEKREKDKRLAGMEFLFDNYKPKFWYVASERVS